MAKEGRGVKQWVTVAKKKKKNVKRIPGSEILWAKSGKGKGERP